MTTHRKAKMKLTIELTHYPFKDDYRPVIKETVERLNAIEGIDVQTFPTATVLVGEYDTLMQILNDTMKWSFETYGKCVFVAKFIPGYEAL